MSTERITVDGLHPRHQVGLADLMLLFQDRERLIEFVASQHGGQK